MFLFIPRKCPSPSSRKVIIRVVFPSTLIASSGVCVCVCVCAICFYVVPRVCVFVWAEYVCDFNMLYMSGMLATCKDFSPPPQIIKGSVAYTILLIVDRFSTSPQPLHPLAPPPPHHTRAKENEHNVGCPSLSEEFKSLKRQV